MVVHGWDLATATGQPFELPEPTLQAVWEYLTEFLPTLPEPVRACWGAAPTRTSGSACRPGLIHNEE
jgi:hypothetical protein